MNRARRTTCLSRHPHKSMSEAEYCNWMLARQLNGEIGSYVCEFSIPLTLADRKIWKSWKIDFAVPRFGYGSPKSLREVGFRGKEKIFNVTEVHESKGWNRSDDNFRLKLNICMRNYPDLPVFVNKERVKFTPTGKVYIRPKRKKFPVQARGWGRSSKIRGMRWK